MKRKRKGLVSYGIFYFNKVCSCKYSRAFVERPSQGTSSLASRLTTVSLDIYIYIYTTEHVATTLTYVVMYT